MKEFWVSSGHQLACRRADGWLEVTDALLLAWLARPELVPPDEACAAERALYARLRAAPRAAVEAAAVAAIADADARENWCFFLGFRDRLLAAGTVEGAYLDLVSGAAPPPPVFLDQLAHLVMRSALDGCDDPFVLRAAELFWRPQRAVLRDGAPVLTDLERAEAADAAAHDSPLFALLGTHDDAVMDAASAGLYWRRSDAHDMALGWGPEAPGRAGLAAAIAAFLRHLLGVEARVAPRAGLAEEDFRWFVGLDAGATALGNALWRGETGDGDGTDRLIGLFRLDFAAGAPVEPRAAGHPVWLLMAAGPGNVLRLKPQNLIAGLPLAVPSLAAV